MTFDLADLEVVEIILDNDDPQIEFCVGDMSILAHVDVKGKSFNYGRTYDSGLAVTPAEWGFTCYSVELIEAFDDLDRPVTIHGDFNVFCDDFSFCEQEC